MSQNKSKLPETKILQEEAKARRDFMKRFGAFGVAAPAVALLLSAKPKQAQALMYHRVTDMADIP